MLLGCQNELGPFKIQFIKLSTSFKLRTLNSAETLQHLNYISEETSSENVSSVPQGLTELEFRPGVSDGNITRKSLQQREDRWNWDTEWISGHSHKRKCQRWFKYRSQKTRVLEWNRALEDKGSLCRQTRSEGPQYLPPGQALPPKSCDGTSLHQPASSV